METSFILKTSEYLTTLISQLATHGLVSTNQQKHFIKEFQQFLRLDQSTTQGISHYSVSALAQLTYYINKDIEPYAALDLIKESWTLSN